MTRFYTHLVAAKIAPMAIVKVYSAGPRAEAETCVAEEFVSLENTPVIMAEIRAGLPHLRSALMARWPIISGVEIENRKVTRRRNPFDATQAATDAAIGIVIVFFYEAAKAAGKKVGETGGSQIAEIMEVVKGWIKGKAHSAPKIRPKRLAQSGGLRKAKKKVQRPSTSTRKRR